MPDEPLECATKPIKAPEPGVTAIGVEVTDARSMTRNTAAGLQLLASFNWCPVPTPLVIVTRTPPTFAVWLVSCSQFELVAWRPMVK